VIPTKGYNQFYPADDHTSSRRFRRRPASVRSCPWLGAAFDTVETHVTEVFPSVYAELRDMTMLM